MSDILAYVVGMIFVCGIPCALGLMAIIIPFRSHRATKKNRFLVLGVINAAFCGLAVLTLLAAAVFNALPGALLFLIIAAGFLAMLLLEATKWFGK